MAGKTRTTIAELSRRVGEELGVSAWTLVDQARIDAFAEVTEDRQFIHIDPARAAQTPFGDTIAHGFLTLSLLSVMAYEVVPEVEGLIASINYGFDKVRFLTPVCSGRSVRGRFKLAEATQKEPGRWLLRYAATVEIEGESRPALVADWLGMNLIKGG
jgi:acyl dehydratase